MLIVDKTFILSSISFFILETFNILKFYWPVFFLLISNNMDHKIPWSDCSIKAAKSRVVGGHFPCLNNVPIIARRDRVTFCGDGVVDDGEECDCGTKEFCENKCCDPTTCKLTNGSSCASGPCCNLYVSENSLGTNYVDNNWIVYLSSTILQEKNKKLKIWNVISPF